MNPNLRTMSFGAILSGAGGGCATFSTFLVMGGVAWFTGFDGIFLGMCAVVALIFLILAAVRVEIDYDTATQKVTIYRRIWPFQRTEELELEYSQIQSFAILEERGSDGALNLRYGFWLADGSSVPAARIGSNALGANVVNQVNRMLELA